MKLFSYTKNKKYGVGILNPQNNAQFVDVTDLDPSFGTQMESLVTLDQHPKLLAALGRATSKQFQNIADVHFELPIANPPKLICLGLNYADHAKEGGNAKPEYPSFFIRVNTSMTPHHSPIVRPKASTKLDYEAELAVIIGKKAKHLTPGNALDCIFGYSCFNDGSLRDFQRKTSQWTIGKNFDATGGFGPWIVTADELPAGASGLRIQSRLNGKIMQDADTHDFLWDVKEALCLITECITLMPGDVIITGTPAGVGYARTPPVWMQPGDICEIEIEGIGTLSNSIVDE